MMGALGSVLALLLPPLLQVLAAAPRGQPLSSAGAAAEARIGCLVEDDLCKSFEICVNDGIFGRCQQVPVRDIYKYDISPPVLQRLRIILEKLSHREIRYQKQKNSVLLSLPLLAVFCLFLVSTLLYQS